MKENPTENTQKIRNFLAKLDWGNKETKYKDV